MAGQGRQLALQLGGKVKRQFTALTGKPELITQGTE
jgi:hypothetical protein